MSVRPYKIHREEHDGNMVEFEGYCIHLKKIPSENVK